MLLCQSQPAYSIGSIQHMNNLSSCSSDNTTTTTTPRLSDGSDSFALEWHVTAGAEQASRERPGTHRRWSSQAQECLLALLAILSLQSSRLDWHMMDEQRIEQP